MAQSALFNSVPSTQACQGIRRPAHGSIPVLGRDDAAIDFNAIGIKALRHQQAQITGTAAQAGAALIIDARSARQFRREHLPGSHSIPAGRLLSGELPDGDLILVTEQPQQALRLIEQLHRDGYSRRIQYLDGGVASWQRQGLPLEVDELLVRRRDGSAAPASLLAGLLLLLLAEVRSLLSPLLLALGWLLRPRAQTRAKA